MRRAHLVNYALYQVGWLASVLLAAPGIRPPDPTIVARIEHPTRPVGRNPRPLQGDVTTIARQVRPPLRRYACGTVESKYIESPAASACSSTPMCTLSVPSMV